MLSNIRIILVNTSHPGNIGAAARAMKTMGLSTLYLVSPEAFPHPNARDMASNAIDVLEKAIVVSTLQEAIADCSLVVGTSSRSRTIPWPMLTPREFAAKAMAESTSAKVALIFGREQAGLTNEELQMCHFHVQIPSNPEYNVLNIAAAVQVLAYELYLASQENIIPPKWDYEFANAEALESFYAHLEKVLEELKFLNPKAPRQLMPRLRRLFNRARVDVMELNILRGILSAIENKANPL